MTTATRRSGAAANPVRPAIPDVVDEHVGEHGFLSLQRRKLLFSLEVPARRLADLDERIAAHWDGLIVNQPKSLARVEAGLAADDPWERVTCVRAWVALGRPAEDALIARWSATPPEHAGSWREALRGLDAADLDRLAGLLSHPRIPDFGLATLVDALGWHGRLDDAIARRCLRHADPFVRAAVARHAHVHVAKGETTPAHAMVDDVDAGVRRRALWSAALTDRESGVDHARRLADAATPDSFALRVLGLLGGPEDHALLVRAAATDAGRPAAFFAFADLGTAAAIDSLVRLLTLPDAALRQVVTEALELAIGPIPRKDAEGPATPNEANSRREEIEALLRKEGARVLAGQRRPWRGEPADEPGAWRWRAAIAKRGREDALRREVPDGFFDALPTGTALPGE